MKLIGANKKSNRQIEMLVIKSFPKKKSIFHFKVKELQFQNVDISAQLQQSNSLRQAKSVSQYESKPKIITIEFDEKKKKHQQTRKNNNRRLITSSCNDQNTKKNYNLYKQSIQKNIKLDQFVQKSLHIGACQVSSKSVHKMSTQLPKKLINYNSKKRSKYQIGYAPNQTMAQFRIQSTQISTTRTHRKFIKKQQLCKKQTISLQKDQINTSLIQLDNKYQLIPIRKPRQRKDYFIFGMTDKNTPQNKVQIYRDFLWKINFSNDIYVVTPQNSQFTCKAYVGTGNNSIMVKSILKRRYWWTIVDKINNANFLWTQLKNNQYFNQQKCSERVLFPINIEQSNEKIQYKDDYEGHKNIFRVNDLKLWKKHMAKNHKAQEKINSQTYLKRIWLIQQKTITKIDNPSSLKLQNHLQCNYYLGNKKALFYNLRRFYHFQGRDVFTIIPMSFHIIKGIEDLEYQQFLNVYNQFEDRKKIDKTFRNIWIAKPGQNTNRGNGISVCFSLDDVKHRLRGRQKNSDGKPRTFILQKYIEKPLLYHRRKFDIRHYLLITCMNGDFKAYWYQEGYIRTSSYQFNLRDTKDLYTHLTNDAVQKTGAQYGKYQKGNKISYQQFQKYLITHFKRKRINFFSDILPRMKQIALDAIKSAYLMLDPKRRQRNFQVFGLDFMIDDTFNPWLIEFNTNPCLELSCPLLERIIPGLIENVLRICVDPLFPPPQNWPTNKRQFFGDNPLTDNKFELMFDQITDGKQIEKIFQQKDIVDLAMGKIEEDNEIFQDDGDQKWEEKQKIVQ